MQTYQEPTLRVQFLIEASAQPWAGGSAAAPCSRGGGWNLNGRSDIDVSDSPVKETLYVKFRLRPGHWPAL